MVWCQMVHHTTPHHLEAWPKDDDVKVKDIEKVEDKDIKTKSIHRKRLKHARQMTIKEKFLRMIEGQMAAARNERRGRIKKDNESPKKVKAKDGKIKGDKAKKEDSKQAKAKDVTITMM